MMMSMMKIDVSCGIVDEERRQLQSSRFQIEQVILVSES